jgi:hypothetical protein
MSHLANAPTVACLLPWPRCTTIGGADHPAPSRKEEVLRKKLTVLVAMAMMLASTGTASAVALSNGQCGFKANERTAFGIATAVVNTQKHDCDFAC